MSVFKPDTQDNLASRAEKVANGAFDRFEKVLDRLDAMVPRPLGAEKVSQHDELNDYLLTIAQAPDPAQAGLERIQEWAGVYGLPKAQKMFVDFVSRNEQRIKKMVDETPAVTYESAPEQEY